MSHAYKEEYQCNFTSVIPTNVYGPHDNYSIEDGHVLPGLIHKCYLAKKNGTDFVIWGSGKPLRQFILADDLGALIVWTLRHYESVEPIVLSVGEEHEVSIEQAARFIAKAMDFTGPIVFDSSKSDGQFKKTASNAKLRALKPDVSFTPMEEGIQRAVDWFVANYDHARK